MIAHDSKSKMAAAPQGGKRWDEKMKKSLVTFVLGYPG